MNPAFTRWGRWWDALELRWPRLRYAILPEPAGDWGTAWLALPRRTVPSSQADAFHEPSWEFEDMEPEGKGSPVPWTGPQARFRVAWPSGGILVPEVDEAQPPVYEPLKVAHDILPHVQRTAVGDPTAILQFVNRWGRLGVGIPGAEEFEADSVTLTGERLGWLTGLVRTVHALQLGQKPPMTKHELAEILTEALAGVHFAARPTPHAALIPRFVVPRLLDALVLEVWSMATSAKRMRQCPECEALFIHGREDKQYCSAVCARRRTVREWKRKQRAAGTRDGAAPAPARRPDDGREKDQ